MEEARACFEKAMALQDRNDQNAALNGAAGNALADDGDDWEQSGEACMHMCMTFYLVRSLMRDAMAEDKASLVHCYTPRRLKGIAAGLS
jgi:hypothetical protein